MNYAQKSLNNVAHGTNAGYRLHYKPPPVDVYHRAGAGDSLVLCRCRPPRVQDGSWKHARCLPSRVSNITAPYRYQESGIEAKVPILPRPAILFELSWMSTSVIVNEDSRRCISFGSTGTSADVAITASHLSQLALLSAVIKRCFSSCR